MVDSVLTDADVTTHEEMSKEMDKYSAEVIAGKNEEGEYVVPSTEFFADEAKYRIWKGDRNTFKQLCENSIAAGAPSAHAVLSKDVPFCSSYIITMPTDKSARAKVIEIHNQFWRTALDIPAPPANPTKEDKEAEEEIADYLAKDTGQKYLVVNFDP